jgi:hypothetical protein
MLTLSDTPRGARLLADQARTPHGAGRWYAPSRPPAKEAHVRRSKATGAEGAPR